MSKGEQTRAAILAEALDLASVVGLEGLSYQLGPLGSPLLEGCLASMECRVQGTLPAGTHSVFVGEVTSWNIQHGKLPLVYWQRDYQDLERNAD